MLKNFRDKAPFILLAFNLLLILCKFLGVYTPLYNHLGNFIGYSLFTNLFMWSVYANKKYCTSTKVAVIGLSVLNILDIIWRTIGINGLIYDFFIILIVVFISLTYKYKI